MGTTVTVLPAQKGWETLKGLGVKGDVHNHIYRAASNTTTREWWEDGNCHDKDPNLFEIQEGQSKQEQHEAIAEGLKICAGCPVMDVCMKNSTEADRYWTTRGGRPPERLFVKESRSVRRGVMEDLKYSEDPCSKCGGFNVKLYLRSNRKHGTFKRTCLDCQRQYAKDRRKADKLKS